MEDHALSMKANPKSRKAFYALLALLLMLCSVQYVLMITIPQAVYLAIVFLILLLGDPDEIIATCICCIPLYGFFESVYAVLFGVACYAVKMQKEIRLNYSIFTILLMILWELLHCFAPNFAIIKFGGQCVPWVLLAVLMCSPNHRFDYAFILRSFIFSVALACFTLFVRIIYIANFQLPMAFAMLQRLGIETENATVKMNPNSLGVFCVLGISGLMQLRIARQGKKGDWVYAVFLLLFGIMTASKTFFICLLFSFMLLFLAVDGSFSKKLRYGMGILCIGLLVTGIVYLIVPGLIENFIGRFYEKDFTTGRMDLMSIYHEFIVTHLRVLLFGIGLQNFGTELNRLCPEAPNSPHNSIQEVIIAWGLPGLLLIIVIWGAMIHGSRKQSGKQKLIHFIPFLVILLKSQAGQILNSEYTVLSFSFAYLSMCANFAAPASQEADLERNLSGGLDFQRAVTFLWKKKILLMAVSLVCAVTAYGVTTSFVTPMYESTVLLYVNNSNLSVSNLVLSNGDITASRSLINTYRIVLKSRQTIQKVIEQSGVQGTYEEIISLITADSANETEILKVVVTDEDPVKAMQIANAIAQVLPERISSIIDGTLPKIIDYAVIASKPSSPSKSVNTMIGCMIGFVITASLLLITAMRKTKIDAQSLLEAFPFPVLASIPQFSDKKPYQIAEKRKKYRKRRIRP